MQHQSPGSPVADVKTTYTPGGTSGVAGFPPHALASSATTGGRTGSASYTYNLDGSMKSRIVNGALTSFSYRADGDLDTVTTATGSSTYIPDADGNTIARRNPDGSTTLYLPGMQAKINAARTGVETTRYYQLGGVQVATRVNKGGVLYVMSDVHGSNQLAVDPVTWSVTRRYLDPYGNPLGAVTGGTWPDDRGFLNKPVNADTGLVDMGAREYDPSTGRFTSVDPILVPDDPQAAHGYVYANNNPMGFSDPTGLMLTVGEGGGSAPSSSPKVAKTTTSGEELWHGGRISTVYAPPAQQPRDFKSGFVKGAGEQFRECVESLDPKNIIAGLQSMVDDPWGAFCSALSSFSHIDQIKAVWDAYQGGDEYVFGEAVGKLAVSVGADLLGKIVGGGAAGLVMSLKSGAKAASNAADAAGDASRASRGLDACPAGAMSFSADTRVLMADGTRKRIDQIREGDQVAAADPETGETGGRAVEATWPHRDDLVTLRTSAGQIVTTEDHPYWNATDSAWEQIQQFNRGDQLLTPDGNRVTVLALDWTTRTDAPAYNLTVTDLHTYNVLTEFGVPVLVHNCGGVEPNDLGKAGEVGAGIGKNNESFPGQSGKDRIPDEFDHMNKVIGEVKNVAYQHLSTQLRDDIAYARKNGYTFNLYVRRNGGTTLSRPLVAELLSINANVIELP
ncbi:YD repeat protein [Intrasporangium calvum DSM 43043]|uniref:YD repeat protein n=1 Tax=Intrasporangium calvum (strain ATCC 23552 / DSM 43043 / JCM 3097 / NBRC 12989 / NCIMB 10167 / NRRL B-3866 / 7 KIP) TaxID=710696 RepID=E6SAA0_INTC7|nr:YD repeat protein [Intrasporangium calvum DSM 43043]